MATRNRKLLTKAEAAALELYARNLKLLNDHWTPHEGQKAVLREIFNGGVKRVFLQAGRKYGKSDCCMYTATRQATLFPNSQVYIIGPTAKQQAEIMWHSGDLKHFAPGIPREINETEKRIKFPNGSFIKLDGSENFEAYRGTKYDLMILDEFKDQDPRFYDAAYPNLLAKDGTLLVVGTPPDTENHYIKLRNQAQASTQWKHFTGTSWDNPHVSKLWLENERKEYIERGEKALWDREYEAKFVPGGASAIFPKFNKRRHSRDSDLIEAWVEKDRKSLQWYTISDPGTQTCFAVLFIAYNPYTSQIFVMDEIYETDRRHTSSIAIWDRVIEKIGQLNPGSSVDDWTHIYDEHAPWFENEIVDHYGHTLEPCFKGLRQKDFQISLMKTLFSKEGYVYLSRKAQNAIWELQNYVTDDKGNYKKIHDHTIDCFRYFLEYISYSLNVEADAEIRAASRMPQRQIKVEHDMVNYQMQQDPFGSLFDQQLEDYSEWGF